MLNLVAFPLSAASPSAHYKVRIHEFYYLRSTGDGLGFLDAQHILACHK